METMELIYFDEFKQLSFDKKLHAVHGHFMRSAYHSIYFYPVLDKKIDWTSMLGIARDGLFLMDAELNQVYMYIPFPLIESVHELSTQINIHMKDLVRQNGHFRSNSSELNSTMDDNYDKGNFINQVTKLAVDLEIPMYPKIQAGRDRAGHVSMQPLMQI